MRSSSPTPGSGPVAEAAERARNEPLQQDSRETGGEHDHRKRHAEHQRREGGDRHRRGKPRADDATADPQHRGHDDADDGGAETSHDARDGRDGSVLHVDERERADEHEAREHEQAARRDRAPNAVQPPADERRQLLRLGSRQRKAERERMEETPLADPSAPLHELVVHDRDLPGGASEGDAPELEPEPHGLAESRWRGGTIGDRGCAPEC